MVTFDGSHWLNSTVNTSNENFSNTVTNNSVNNSDLEVKNKEFTICTINNNYELNSSSLVTQIVCSSNINGASTQTYKINEGTIKIAVTNEN